MRTPRSLLGVVLLAAAACGPAATPPAVSAGASPSVLVSRTEPADLDPDGDGVLGAADKCPKVPEDCDGILDDDGCPEADADGDNVPDVCDHCPREMGVDDVHHPYGRGCPWIDAFVSEGEFLHGVRVMFSKGSATVSKESLTVLAALAPTMQAQGNQKYFVVGHAWTDEPRPDELSAARAAAVRDALVQLGVDSARLEAHGAGTAHPDYDIASSPPHVVPESSRRVELDVTHDYARERAWVEASKEVVDVPPVDLPCDVPPPPPGPCKRRGR